MKRVDSLAEGTDEAVAQDAPILALYDGAIWLFRPNMRQMMARYNDRRPRGLVRVGLANCANCAVCLPEGNHLACQRPDGPTWADITEAQGWKCELWLQGDL